MSDNTAGFSIRDAWAEAEQEEALSEAPSEETDIPSSEADLVSDEEQPAVESVEEPGLFGDLDEKEDQTEQPQNVDSIMVDVDGQQISVADLRAGYMMKADYTRKTQELAELRNEAKDALAIYEALQTNPQATIQKLWEASRTGQPVIPTPETDTPSDVDALVAEKVEAALANDPRIRAMQEQAAVDEVNAIFAGIEEAYGQTLNEADKVFVLQKANEWGNPDIESVFAKLLLQKQRVDKERANVVSNATSQGYGGTESVGMKPKAPTKYGSWREAMSETLAEEGIDNAGLQAAISNL